MGSFLNKNFHYLDSIQQRIIHVVIILIFSVLFLVVFEPFKITEWIKYPEWLKYYGLVSLGVFLSLIIAFSQLILRTFIPIKDFKIIHLLLWFISEILIISFVYALLFEDDTTSFLNELIISFKFISVGLILPYSFSILIIMLLHQKSRLKDVETNIPPENTVSDSSDLINFKDERELVKFTLKKEYILFLESADNYISVIYLIDGNIKKEMIRNSMKKIEELLDSNGIVRCHRSFMVNMENVQWLKKDGRNYQLKVKNYDTLIPVSRSYTTKFKSLIED